MVSLSNHDSEQLMPWLYILKCSDGSYYTGTTADPDKRVAEHQEGMVPGYTFDRRPVELVYSEEFPEWSNVVEREFQIKKWSRKKKEAFIREDWDALKRLSRSKSK